MSQNQNRDPDPGISQFQRLGQRTDPKKGTLLLQQMGNRHRSVTIGIGLNNGHDRSIGFFPNRIQIMPNGIQIDHNMGIITTQEKSSHMDRFLLFYHKTFQK